MDTEVDTGLINLFLFFSNGLSQLLWKCIENVYQATLLLLCRLLHLRSARCPLT